VLVTNFIDGVSPDSLSARHLVRWDITTESVTALAETLRCMRQNDVYVDSPEASILITRPEATKPRFVVIDPVDSPEYGVNRLEDVTEEVASWKTSPHPHKSTERSREDTVAIKQAFRTAQRYQAGYY
jgi:hypothetical protein